MTNGFIYRIAIALHSRPQRAVFDAEMIGYGTHRTAYAADGAFFNTRAISALLMPCCPIAIGRFIVSRIVNAVYAVLWRWPFAHVLQKHCKGFSPTHADLNSERPVSRVTRVCGVRASSLHRTPCYVSRRALSFVCCVPMGAISNRGHVSLVAAAAFAETQAEVGELEGFFSAALASAKPIGFPLGASSDNSPAMELKSGVVAHKANPVTLSIVCIVES